MSEKMKLAVVGMGSIGGTFAAHLDPNKFEISATTRREELLKDGENGKVIFQGKHKEDGLLEGKDKEVPVNFQKTGADIGEQDIVVIAMPANGELDDIIVNQIKPMLKQGTAVVFLQNGYPTYYRDLINNQELPKAASDPDDKIINAIREAGAGIIGGVVDISAEAKEGTDNHFLGDFIDKYHPKTEEYLGRFLGKVLLGAVDEGVQDKVDYLYENIDKGRLPVVSADRQKLINDTCTKLLGNLSANLLSMITKRNLDDLMWDDDYYKMAKDMMDQAIKVLAKLGMSESLVKKYKAETALNYKKELEHLASTAVDYQNGKPTEIDVLTGAVIDLNEYLEGIGQEEDISLIEHMHSIGRFMIDERDHIREYAIDPANENGKMSWEECADHSRSVLLVADEAENRPEAVPTFGMAA